MDPSPPALSLVRDNQAIASAGLRSRAFRVLGSIAIHLLPLALLASALPLKPKNLGGTFGQSVAVTLVSGTLRQASAPARATPPSLTSLEQRLSDNGPIVAAPSHATQAASPTRLSDLFDAQVGISGQSSDKGPPRPVAAGDDDPFARASVSYRGDDPEKTARLRVKAQACARGATPVRVLLIINSEGYLVAKPRALGAPGTNKGVLRTIDAIERCSPFAEAATPGPPRSYEIEIG